MNFFTIAKSDELDRKLLPGGIAGKETKRPGQLINIDRLPHVENIGLAVLAASSRAEDQVDSFRNAHEEARRLRIGHSNGAAFLNLFVEQSQNAARTACHIPKSNVEEW